MTRIFAIFLDSGGARKKARELRYERFGIDRLRDVPVEARGERAFAIADHGASRDSQNRDTAQAVVLLQAMQYLVAVDARQLQVAENQGRIVDGRGRKSVLARGAGDRRMAERP